jgi:protein-tyrosine phosphatase
MRGKRVLFLCTGNYYRSRFAEELFNHLCREQNLGHSSTSRALALERGGLWNIGPMSRHALRALELRGVTAVNAERPPQPACDDDFQAADIVVALKEREHRALVESRFPSFQTRVRYWHVHDLDGALPAEATRQIDQLVRELIDELKVERA